MTLFSISIIVILTTVALLTIDIVTESKIHRGGEV